MELITRETPPQPGYSFFFFQEGKCEEENSWDRSPQISILSLGPLYFAEAARILGC